MKVCYIVLHFNKRSIDLPRERLVVPLSVSTEERRRADNPSPLILQAAAAAPDEMIHLDLTYNRHVSSQHVVLMQSVGGNPSQDIVYPLPRARIRAIGLRGAQHRKKLNVCLEPVIVFGVVVGKGVRT